MTAARAREATSCAPSSSHRRRGGDPAAPTRRRPATSPGALVDGGVQRDRGHDDRPGRGRADRGTGPRRVPTDVIVGAGTVLDAATARAVIDAGATFVVSPVFAPEIIDVCRRPACAVMPGCFTPTEILARLGGRRGHRQGVSGDVARPGVLQGRAARRCRSCG